MSGWDEYPRFGRTPVFGRLLIRARRHDASIARNRVFDARRGWSGTAHGSMAAPRQIDHCRCIVRRCLWFVCLPSCAPFHRAPPSVVIDIDVAVTGIYKM